MKKLSSFHASGGREKRRGEDQAEEERFKWI